jgi:hypothetical protein
MSIAARFEIALACFVACGDATPPTKIVPPVAPLSIDAGDVVLEERIAIVADDKVVHLRGSGALAIDEVIAQLDHAVDEAMCVESVDAVELAYKCDDPQKQTARVTLHAPMDLVIARSGHETSKHFALPLGTKITREPPRPMEIVRDVRDLGPADRCARPHAPSALKASATLGSVKEGEPGIVLHAIFIDVPSLHIHTQVASFGDPFSSRGTRSADGTSITFWAMFDDGITSGELLVRDDALYAFGETKFRRVLIRAPLPCGAKVELETVREHAPM